MKIARILALFLVFAFVLPLGVRAVQHSLRDDATHWSRADWSSTRILPDARAHEPAMVRVYSARVGRWRGLFATHSWIVIKERGGEAYQRFDKVGWGAPIRVNGYAPDGRWFGNDIEEVFAADGPEAEALIAPIRAAVASYRFAQRGDYVAWPGPNSNTFVAAVLAAIPEARIALPPTAIGKDFPVNGDWAGLSPSRTGVRLSLGGYASVTLAWVEGIEINLLGLVAGLDIRRPGVKIPTFGRFGF
jgi:hypothetical protein